MRILIIEDEAVIADTIKEELATNYSVDTVATGKEGIYSGTVNDYDLIILDLALPDMSGREVCRSIRHHEVTTPILVLTANDEIIDKVTVLDSGADDYLTKPFNFDELSARIRALLRRNPQGLTSNILVLGDLIVDTVKRQVKRGGRTIRLRRKEFDLLEYLARNSGRVLTRGMILEHVWDSNVDSFTNAIDVHIKYLRDHIDKPFNKKLIKTVHGLGYKLDIHSDQKAEAS